MKLLVFILVYAFFLVFTHEPEAGPLDEERCCVKIERYSDGTIKRRKDVRDAFQQRHYCPSTNQPTGPCPGWQKDHIIPLACGGVDAVSNMQWLPLPIKTASGKYPKDRFERKIYCTPTATIKH